MTDSNRSNAPSGANPARPANPSDRDQRGITTDDVAGAAPGTNVTGSDTPGGGGTQPLEFTEDGRAIPPDAAERPEAE